MRSPRITTLAILVALLAAPALSGCAGIEGMVEQATGGDVSLPGNSVPDDFPTEVPLVDGEVVMGAGIGTADGKAWNVTIKVTGLDATDDIKAQLEGAGFTAAPGATTGESSALLYTSAAYSVAVVVTKDTNDGFLANYTVTDATAQ